MTIEEVKSQPAGAVIKSVKGILRSVGIRAIHNRPDGSEYSAQPFTLAEDAHAGHAIEGVIFDHYDITQYLDKEIILCSFKSRNGRFGGVTTTKFQPSGSIFGGHRPAEITSLRVTKVGVLHTPETWALTKRTE